MLGDFVRPMGQANTGIKPNLALVASAHFSNPANKLNLIDGIKRIQSGHIASDCEERVSPVAWLRPAQPSNEAVSPYLVQIVLDIRGRVW